MVVKPIIGGIASVALILLAIILKVFVLPPVIKQQIAQQVAIQTESETYKYWEALPVPIYFKVYLFNVTNPDAVHRGLQKPIVKDIGPYVYRQYRQKEATFSDDKQKVFYRQKLKFYFDKTLSAPHKEDDEIVMVDAFLNVVLQSTGAEVKTLLKNLFKNNNSVNNRNPITELLSSISQLPILNSVLQTTEAIEPAVMGTINTVIDDIFGKHQSLFVKTSARKVLFDGVQFCKNPSTISAIVCDMIKKRNAKNIRVLKDGSMKFAFFYHKNTTDDGLFEANTGLTNVERVGQIIKWNSAEKLTVWPNNNKGETICNMINGSDASNFRPYQTASHNFPLYSFSTDICRSSELVYKEEGEFKGIPVLRFHISDTFLNKLGPEYSSGCFCPNKIANIIVKPNGCLYSGALDLSPCVVRSEPVQ